MEARTISLVNPGDFPIELLMTIFTHVDLTSIGNLALVCHAFHACSNNELLWQAQCKNYGFDLPDQNTIIHSKEFFKQKFCKTFYLVASEGVLPEKNAGLSFFQRTFFNTPYTLEQIKKMLSDDCLVYTDIEIDVVREFAMDRSNMDGSKMIIIETLCHPAIPLKEISYALYGYALHFTTIDPSTLDTLLSNVKSVEILPHADFSENREDNLAERIKMHLSPSMV